MQPEQNQSFETGQTPQQFPPQIFPETNPSPQLSQPFQPNQTSQSQQPIQSPPQAFQPTQTFPQQNQFAPQSSQAFQNPQAQTFPNPQNPQQNPQFSQAAPQQPARRENPSSTQATLLISELRDSMVIMKDGSFRAVVACKSINFDLMSENEREGVEYSYQNFLNSLNFNIQVLIRSQRVDIGPYIEKLTNLRRNNDNMLLSVLMDDYIDFIDVLSQEANIMDKAFFIVIPYYSSFEAEKAVEQTKNFFKSFTRGKTPPVTRIDRAVYDKAVTEINNRVEAVISGLFQIGVHSVRLNTKELSQLYYNFNNPDTAVREPLGDFNKLAHLYVRKGNDEEQSEVKGGQ